MEREYQDNDYKYFMQDSGTIYLGGRYSYQEILENEMVSFKFKSIIEHYISKDTDLATTLESHLYYMTQDQFSYRTYKQLKARVKISVLREKKTLFSGTKVGYQTETVKLDTFTQWNLAQKKKQGVIVQELILSKLALMTFIV